MDINQDDEDVGERRKIYLKKIKKAEYRKRSMFYITKHLGKGIKISLSKVKIVNS